MLHKCYEPFYSTNWEGYREKRLFDILNLISPRYPCVSPWWFAYLDPAPGAFLSKLLLMCGVKKAGTRGFSLCKLVTPHALEKIMPGAAEPSWLSACCSVTEAWASPSACLIPSLLAAELSWLLLLGRGMNGHKQPLPLISLRVPFLAGRVSSGKG